MLEAMKICVAGAALALAITVATAWAQPPAVAAPAAPACGWTAGAIGYRLIPFKDSRKAAVWYPSSSPQTSFAYSKDISTTLADDGAAQTGCGRFPLVVFAHGLLGCGSQAIFFTEALARFGYVVVAPDYLDAGLCRLEAPSRSAGMVKEMSVFKPEDWEPTTYADRMEDTEAIITLIAHDPTFGPIVDDARTGIAGHSLGGYTAQGLAGGWPSWRDPRVKAVLLFSPYSLPFLVRGTLGGVKVPLMYQGAQGDIGMTPFLEGPNGAYTHSNAPKYFVRLYGGSHLSWTNAVCAGYRVVAACLKSDQAAQLIDEYGIAFFEKYLKGRNQPLLEGRGPGLSAYLYQE